jgi:hypothetical protein
MNAANLSALTVAQLLAAGRRIVAGCLCVDRKQLIAALAHQTARNAA